MSLIKGFIRPHFVPTDSHNLGTRLNFPDNTRCRTVLILLLISFGIIRVLYVRTGKRKKNSILNSLIMNVCPQRGCVDGGITFGNTIRT